MEKEVGFQVKERKAHPKRKPHYCVVFTRSLKQWEVTEAIQNALPDGKGEVFYPCVELWWHGLNTTRYRALFPGYVFIRSEMGTTELHEFIRQNRKDIFSFVKELHLSERRMEQIDVFAEHTGMKKIEPELIDLTDDEAEFFDCMLGFEYDEDYERRRRKAEKEGRLRPEPPIEYEESMSKVKKEKIAIEAELRRRKNKLPKKGVIQISFGYKENGRYVVMDGPLKGHEDRIVDHKVKDQKAYLDVSIAGHLTKAGLVLLGKKVWFPDDKDAPDVLSDGTELRAGDLTDMMSANYFEKEKKEERREHRQRSRRKRR